MKNAKHSNEKLNGLVYVQNNARKINKIMYSFQQVAKGFE